MNGSGACLGLLRSRLTGRAVWLLVALVAFLLGALVFPPTGGQSAGAAEVIDPAALRLLDDQTRITLASFRYNRANQTYLGTATVTNTATERLDAPLYLVVAAVGPAGASVVGATGLTTAGQPYYDLSALLPGGALAAGATSNPLALQMKNPTPAPMQLDLHVYGRPTAVNQAPTAHAGPDQTAPVGAPVTLDGSRSTDPDSDPLTFAWAFVAKPPGSAAVLVEPTAIHPSFILDLPGAYDLQLVVSDGRATSAPATVRISTHNSPPVAHAGPDQTAFVGAAVTLDGSKSTDVDGDLLAYRWSLRERPAGSNAALAEPTAIHPTVVLDWPGVYVVQLVVDDGALDSTPATVTLSTENSRPSADAGPDQRAFVGATVFLDGAGSRDPDFDPLAYIWALLDRPASSTAELANPTTAHPSFSVDRAGTYLAQLIVSDGVLAPAPRTPSRSPPRTPARWPTPATIKPWSWGRPSPSTAVGPATPTATRSPTAGRSPACPPAAPPA